MTTAPPSRTLQRAWANGIPVGRIGGIRIVVSFSWVLSVVLIAVLATPIVRNAVPGTPTGVAIAVAVALGVLLGVSVLVHELGHCLAARALGMPVLQVRLYLLGGVSELGRSPVSAKEEALVAGAGPGLSVVLTGLFFLLLGSTERHTLPWLIILELAFSNGIVAVFNLLPALPLDGGRVLRAGVWGASGRRRWGTIAGSFGGYLLAAALVVWSVLQLGGGRVGLLQAVIGVAMAAFIGFGAFEEHRGERVAAWPSELGLAHLAQPVVQLPEEVPVGLALQAAGGRAVLLTAASGVASGLLDMATAVRVAATDPRRPALELAVPIRPEMIVLPDDDPTELSLRLPGLGPLLVLIDADGAPSGVVPTDRVRRILERP
jgi:Zn-dependent protease